MADNDGSPGLERVEQTDEIADQMEHGVLIDCRGRVALAIAAHIRRHRVEAGRRERRDLVAPGIPGFREAVAEQHQRPAALFGYVEADAIALDYPLRRFAHDCLSLEGVCGCVRIKPFNAGRSASGNASADSKRRLSI